MSISGHLKRFAAEGRRADSYTCKSLERRKTAVESPANSSGSADTP